MPDYKPWTGFPKQEITNNKFLNDLEWADKATNPDESLEEARRQARLSNNVWLATSENEEYLANIEKQMDGILAGTYKKVPIDPTILSQIDSTLKTLGSSCEILSAEEGTFRFKYNGPVKHRSGMEAWCEKMLRDEGVEVRGVYFECRRTRDAEDC